MFILNAAVVFYYSFLVNDVGPAVHTRILYLVYNVTLLKLATKLELQ